MTKALLIAWLAITAAILWRPTHSTDFQTRWVAMSPAMSWDVIQAARKASARPSFCMWDYPGTACRVS
jgi:hypothetical protein